MQYVKCLDCGYIGHQFTDWLPPGTSLNRLDSDRRLKNRLRKRIERGNLTQTTNQRLRRTNQHRISDDTLKIEVTIIKGRLAPGLQRRYTTLTAKRTQEETE